MAGGRHSDKPDSASVSMPMPSKVSGYASDGRSVSRSSVVPQEVPLPPELPGSESLPSSRFADSLPDEEPPLLGTPAPARSSTRRNAKQEPAGPGPWDALESGSTVWADFSPADQDRIVRHYAPKIRYLALRLKARLPKNVELTDLLSSGTLGLMEAFGRFRPQLGIRFETYAENRIRGAMLDELRRLDWFPRSLRQHVRQLDEAVWRIEHEKGRPPTEEELQNHTGLSSKDVRTGLEALQNHLCLSLDAIQDSLAQENESAEGDPYQDTALTELIDRVAALVDTLTPREKLVLSLYYTDELNMRETADVMGITEGRVSQLHTQALTRLRRAFLEQHGEEAMV